MQCVGENWDRPFSGMLASKQTLLSTRVSTSVLFRISGRMDLRYCTGYEQCRAGCVPSIHSPYFLSGSCKYTGTTDVILPPVECPASPDSLTSASTLCITQVRYISSSSKLKIGVLNFVYKTKNARLSGRVFQQLSNLRKMCHVLLMSMLCHSRLALTASCTSPYKRGTA